MIVKRLPKMRSAFALVVIGSSLLLGSTALGQNWPNPPPRTLPDSAHESKVYPVGDAVGVYRAVLDLLYVDGKERPPFIVLWDTAARAAGGPCASPCKRSWPHKSKIDTTTILAYGLPPNSPRIIDFGYRIPIKLINGDELQRITHNGYGYLADRPPDKVGPVEALWAGFRRKYGGAWGFAFLGRVAFNPRHTEALIGVMQRCGEQCRSVEAIFLKRFGNKWRVIERIPDNVETYTTFGTLRYRGPAGEFASQSQIVAVGRSGLPPRSESDDAAKVYRVVLDSLYSFHGESPRTIAITEKRAYGYMPVPTHRSRIDSSTIASFMFYARVFDPLYPRIKYRIPITWLSDETLKSLERAGAPLALAAAQRFEYAQSPLWLAFHARYPRAWGYASLGRVGFNSEHTEALIRTQHFCGTTCVNEDVWFLKRSGEKWYVVERIAGENAARLGIEGLRYLGPDANQSWYGPRRAHGTVTNVLTGEPLPLLDVAVYEPSGYAQSIRTDAKGRYALDHLPLTGAILFKVKCPIDARSDSLYGGVLPMKPGLDTTFDIRFNYRYCLHLNRAHPLLARATTADTVNRSPVAASSEEAVYSAVLDAFYPPGGRENQRIMLEPISAKACAWCIEREVPRLVRKGQLDPSTELGFAAVQKTSIKILPLRGYRRKVEVMPLEDVELLVGPNKWDTMTDAYPGATTLIQFSRVGFNDSGTEALVSVRTDSAGATGIAETMLLKKVGAEWRIALRDVAGEATSGEWSGNKCEATDAPARAPDSTEIEKLIGRFTIVRVGATRDFRGRTDSVRIRLGPLRASPRNNGTIVAPVDVLDARGRPEKKIAGTMELHGSYAEITFMERLPEGVYQFDGWIEQYKILRTSGRDFFGMWETSSGPTVPSVGYFCSRSAAGR